LYVTVSQPLEDATKCPPLHSTRVLTGERFNR
jgi:hypothetical protein